MYINKPLPQRRMIEFISQVVHTLYDVEGIIAWGGLLLVCAIIFAETGLFLGFFLPGDSLLITAGIFAATGYLNLWMLLALASLCAIAGNQVNYYIGRKAGKYLYSREDSFFFRKRHLEKARQFYDRHGPKAIVICRFVPIVRTFAPAVAGTVDMKYSTFTAYNIIGGLLWVLSTVLGGYFLGRIIPDIERYVQLIIIVVIALSFVPVLAGYMKRRKSKASG